VANSPAVEVVIEAALDVLHNNPDGTKACIMLLMGHSDRDDTQDLSADERHRNEYERSRERAESARAWLLDTVNERAQTSGLPTVNDFRGDENLFVPFVSLGAVQLVSEQDRPRNRRVIIEVASTNVQVVADNDRQTVDLMN
jgi:hypothetical protein